MGVTILEWTDWMEELSSKERKEFANAIRTLESYGKFVDNFEWTGIFELGRMAHLQERESVKASIWRP